MPPSYDRIILSGASGAIGAYVLGELAASHPQSEIICLARGPASAAKIQENVGPDRWGRIRVINADLTRAEEMAAAGACLARANRVLAVHCAADVSWTKSERLLGPVNVEGARLFAELAIQTCQRRPVFVFLSTAFLSEDGAHRNAYEKTKLAAEVMLAERHGRDIDLAIVRCSLVVGDSSNGYISRFNGLYPLVRLVSLGEVPCVVAERDYKVDTVPVDFVAKQIAAVANSDDIAEPRRLVAAAGGERSLGIVALVERIQTRANHMRRLHGKPPLPQVSVINSRQYRFLMRASATWNMTARFEKVEQISALMAGYIAHGETGRPITPVTAGSPAPDPNIS